MYLTKRDAEGLTKVRGGQVIFGLIPTKVTYGLEMSY